MSDQLEFIFSHLLDLLIGFPGQRPGGLALSILLSSASIIVGLAIAIVVGMAHHSRWRVVRVTARLYVHTIRGVPLIVLLVIVHQFGSTGAVFGLTTSSLGSAFVTLVLYASAYQADAINGGIAAVPQQLIDDARLYGAGRLAVAYSVSLPYGLRVMRPALATLAITIFKDSSVVVVLGVADLTTTARIILGGDVTNAPYWVATYLAVGLLYFLTAFSLSRVVLRFEARDRGSSTGAINRVMVSR